MRDEMIDTMTRTRIDKYANLSTGHLTEEVRLALDATDYERNKGMAPEWRGRLIMMRREYGWFIYIPVLEESLSSEEYPELPQCLRDCFDLARAHGASWFLFDRDESLNGDIPIYEGCSCKRQTLKIDRKRNRL